MRQNLSIQTCGRTTDLPWAAPYRRSRLMEHCSHPSRPEDSEQRFRWCCAASTSSQLTHTAMHSPAERRTPSEPSHRRKLPEWRHFDETLPIWAGLANALGCSWHLSVMCWCYRVGFSVKCSKTSLFVIISTASMNSPWVCTRNIMELTESSVRPSHIYINACHIMVYDGAYHPPYNIWQAPLRRGIQSHTVSASGCGTVSAPFVPVEASWLKAK